MSKQADEKKNIITKIAEEITSGGMKIIIEKDKVATEEEEE